MELSEVETFQKRFHLGAQIKKTFTVYKYQYREGLIDQPLTIEGIRPSSIDVRDKQKGKSEYIHLSWDRIQLTEKGWREIHTDSMGRAHLIEEFEWIEPRPALTQEEAQHIHERIQSALLVIKDALDEDDVYEEMASEQVERCDDALRFSGTVFNDIASLLLKQYSLQPPQLPEAAPLETAP